MNNRQARIRKGDKLYYFEDYDVESIDRGDEHGTDQILVPSGSPTELPIGLTFDVNVNVGNDGRTIMLGLKPEKSARRKYIAALPQAKDPLLTGISGRMMDNYPYYGMVFPEVCSVSGKNWRIFFREPQTGSTVPMLKIC